MIKKVLFCVIFMLSGCSSAPTPETQYFVLTPKTLTTSTATSKTLQNDSKNVVVIESIKLAEFLDQSGIILQTDTHQIKVAHYHRWGEQLKRNLHRYISETLGAQLPQYVFRNDSKFNPSAPYQYLDISIRQFNGTTDGLALLSGHWILKDSDTNTFRINKSFSYQASLSNSGYPELVNHLALLLEQLCNDIGSSMKTN